MKQYISNFRKFRPLLNELIARDIKIKYRRSILGVCWTLLNPLFMMIVLSIVFSNLFKFDVENFPLYLLSGQVVFNFFSESTSNAMTSVINNAPLIKKIYVPKYLFVLSRVASSAINLFASFTALILVMLVLRTEMHFTVIFTIIPLALLILFSIGAGLILASVAVKFRDVVHLYSVFVTALMYLTPVIYPMSILPDKIKIIVSLNPITNFLIMFRDLVLNGYMPNGFSLMLGTVETVAILIIGLRVFYKQQDTFILNV